jgi:hypothetical protein
MKLTYAMVKIHRERLRKAQGEICPLCEQPLSAEDAVLDHDHVTGEIRGALHAGCNRAEGKAINWIYRTKSQDPAAFAAALAKYWSKDYSGNPIYPTHKTAEEKRLARNAKARKQRAAKKSTGTKRGKNAKKL